MRQYGMTGVAGRKRKGREVDQGSEGGRGLKGEAGRWKRFKRRGRELDQGSGGGRGL